MKTNIKIKITLWVNFKSGFGYQSLQHVRDGLDSYFLKCHQVVIANCCCINLIVPSNCKIF